MNDIIKTYYNDIVRTYYNKNVTIDFLNTYLNPLGFSINMVKSNGINIIDVVDKSQCTVICCLCANRHIVMSFFDFEINEILLNLLLSRSFILFGDNIISNPYYGCQSIEEMNVKKDLLLS